MEEIASRGGRPVLTVVIASMCNEARFEQLKRACDSVRDMARGHAYRIIVVANGARVSDDVMEWLGSRADVRSVRLTSGSYPLARRVGAELADSEFLAFLDDDDEFLPDTFAVKLAYFREHPDVDVLVTDGLRVDGSIVTPIFPTPGQLPPDTVDAMMSLAWGACSLTLRAKAIDLSVFDPQFRHFEWTLAALLLARTYRFGFLQTPTYRYYADTPNSLSKHFEFATASPDLWSRLLEAYTRTPYVARIGRRYRLECHYVSWEFAKRGLFAKAWSYHVRSLAGPDGARYLPFTLKLLVYPVWNVFHRTEAHAPAVRPSL